MVISPLSDRASTSTYSYTTVRYLIDEDREIDVPVGVALCDMDRRRIYFRLPQSGERIARVPLQKAMASLNLAQSKIERWLETGKVPYATEEATPLSEAWWKQVQDLMQFRIRIGSLHPIDCQQPAEEIESLFEAVVKPEVAQVHRTERVDGAVTRALGDRLAKHFEYGAPVPGYRQRQIKVTRHLVRDDALVVIEGINLASPNAVEDTFALVGKLHNIQRNQELKTEFVLGYLASPSGLNGEADLKEFIEKEIEAPVLDLTRESSEFRARVVEALHNIPQGADLLKDNNRAIAA